MEVETTKQRILSEALRLFSSYGYSAVSVERIADEVGIRAPSLYKHYKSKQDIFDHILTRMEQLDRENAAAFYLPEETKEDAPESYDGVSIDDLIGFSKCQFRYWTENEFASCFRKLLTLEQYRSEKMSALYHQYLGNGPLGYAADILGSMEEALSFYAPMYLLYSIYDVSEDRSTVYGLLETHFEDWKKRNKKECNQL